MRVLITGICGYVGSRIARRLVESVPGVSVYGIDSLARRGSETNLQPLQDLGVRVAHGDIRLASDVEALPGAMDWVIDCAANPAVMAGLDREGQNTSRRLVEHNLLGTAHILEYCRQRNAGLVLLSSSRVYSIEALRRVPLREGVTRFEPDPDAQDQVAGFSERGVSESFSTAAPISLYGATKLASEVLALEYGEAFGFPVRVNRCGVIGGPGQFGRADQGILAFWVYSCLLGRPLTYIGYGGSGKQVRDCVLAEDVADLVLMQMRDPHNPTDRVTNVGGGVQGALSLREMTALCEAFLGRTVQVGREEQERPYDIPYFVTDCDRARRGWGWKPSCTGREIVLRLCEWTADHTELVQAFPF
ncbi:MAG: NAD-dependent epimerase/dehydratase family protein [Anaerolineae bacterium]|nr:NAD-dependent epimerase/dehydratase family protein [Anaerolineae bacterium]